MEAGYLTYFDWLGAAPEIDQAAVADTVEADVVVIGGGNSGVCAALAAAEAGASVAVVEVQAEADYTFLGHDIGHLNSNWSHEHGGDVIDEIEFVQDWMRRNMNRTNPLLVRQFAAESGKALDWILSHLDSAIIENCGIFGVPKPTAYPGEISGYRSVCNGQQLWRTLRPAVLHPYRRYQHRVGHHHGQDRRRDRGGVVIRSLRLPHTGPRASVRGPLWGRPFQPYRSAQ